MKNWPKQPQRYPSPERHYQEPYRGQHTYRMNMPRPPLPLPPMQQHGAPNIDRLGATANIDQGGPFYASVATLQRDRAKGMTLVRGEKDGPIFYENPYHAMPQNKNINR